MPEQETLEAAVFSRTVKAVAVLTGRGVLDADASLLRAFSKRNMEGIIVCLDRPPSAYKALLEEQGIDVDTYYVDATGSRESDAMIIASNGIGDLTSLGIDIFKLATALRSGGKELFVLFDAIESVHWYNGMETVARFLHTGNLRFRQLGIYQAYVVGTKGGALPEIIKFCDKVIESGTAG